MSIVVTGATGQLGRLTVEALLRRGIPAAEIVATGRNVEAISDLRDRGVTVKLADFADAATLRQAFADAEKLVLVSTTVPSERRGNHERAIDAAVDAGVSLVAYTSQVNADSATTILGKGHLETEAYLRKSGLPTVFLRNGWYLETYTGSLPAYVQNHAILGAAGQSRVNAASRADYAEAAAAVVTTDGHAGAVYELGGDDAFTLPELAAAVARATGERIEYRDMSVAELAEVLRGLGLPGDIAEAVADLDVGINRGEWLTDSGHLRKLIGRATTTLSDAISAALR
jgi:NAD(P)H dehydrogenase (quinone)